MESPQRTTIDIRVRDDAAGAMDKATMVRRPFDIEHVFTARGAAFDFRWDGSRAYLAWHDMTFSDHEMSGDGFRTTTTRDLRRKMTFFPTGVQASGWCDQVERANSYAALYFDQTWLFDQLETPERERALAPIIYFHDRVLLDSMEKLGRIARARSVAPRLVLDSVVLLAGVELLRVQGSARKTPGGLSDFQMKTAKDYIEAHLFEDVALADIAAATGLSTHHFVRAFKQREGLTPYRYLLERRIERAQEMIDSGSVPIATVGQQVGFKSASHFSRTFAQIVGKSPRSYRRDRRN